MNSHAVGMAVAEPFDFEIDFTRNPISGSAAWFFVIMLKFIFPLILEIHEKNPWHEKMSFSMPDLIKIEWGTSRAEDSLSRKLFSQSKLARGIESPSLSRDLRPGTGISKLSRD